MTLVTRVKHWSAVVGPAGGLLRTDDGSSEEKQIAMADLRPGSLVKNITVTLQSLKISDRLGTALFGHCHTNPTEVQHQQREFIPVVSASPVVTIEPRKRKFHEPIVLTLPLPTYTKTLKNLSDEMINRGASWNKPRNKDKSSRDTDSEESSDLTKQNLRLLYSVKEGAERAEWREITGETPLTLDNTKENVSLTTTVSARYWFLHVQDPLRSEAIAKELYTAACRVPYVTKFSLFAKKIDEHVLECRLFCTNPGQLDPWKQHCLLMEKEKENTKENDTTAQNTLQNQNTLPIQNASNAGNNNSSNVVTNSNLIGNSGSTTGGSMNQVGQAQSLEGFTLLSESEEYDVYARGRLFVNLDGEVEMLEEQGPSRIGLIFDPFRESQRINFHVSVTRGLLDQVSTG